jgi:hypothetical protein
MRVKFFAALAAVCVWVSPMLPIHAWATDVPLAVGADENTTADLFALQPIQPTQPTPPEPQNMRWEVRASDITLAKTLERWSAAGGHKLKWDAARNFLIGAPDVYIGSFEGAVHNLLFSPGIRLSDYPLEACIYANTPPLIRITRQGEQTRECAAANPN